MAEDDAAMATRVARKLVLLEQKEPNTTMAKK